MPQRTWREIAHAVIQQALQEAQAQGLDSEATKQFVNSRYPFGERAYHPYKIWLSEMKATFGPSKARQPAQSDMDKLKAWNEGKPL